MNNTPTNTPNHATYERMMFEMSADNRKSDANGGANSLAIGAGWALWIDAGRIVHKAWQA